MLSTLATRSLSQPRRDTKTRRHDDCFLLGCMVGSWVGAPLAQAPPSRIVSLVPAATEMLFAIGAGPRVVAVSSYDHEPPAVERLPRVGALLDPDLERIMGLRPDLVVVYGTQARPAATAFACGDPGVLV